MENINKNNKVIDLTEILADYSGKWVVLSYDEKHVLKSGNSLDEISDFIKKGVVMLVPDYEYAYSPYYY